MATVTNVEIIKTLLLHEGRDPEESNGSIAHQSIAIYRYEHRDAKGEHFMVAYHHTDIPAMFASTVVKSPELLWDRFRGLTDEGRKLIDNSTSIRREQDEQLLRLLWDVLPRGDTNYHKLVKHMGDTNDPSVIHGLVPVTAAGLVAKIRDVLGVF
jgi:hypothetical protein